MCGRSTILLLAFLVFAFSVVHAATPLDRPLWPGFQVIMWQTKTARQYQALRMSGVTAARVQADRAGETAASAAQKVLPIIQGGLRPYVENIATDFYSAYHRWVPGKQKNAAFLALQRAVIADPKDKSVFVRRPSLSDPRALARIERRITRIVRLYAPYRPLFFNLGDETGIADLSAAWDFDFSASSLSAMRVWLENQYGTLAALNSEWGTHFGRWRDVVPPTTTQTMKRTDGNYAAWSDFKRWMDVAYARAIQAGTQAVHAGAPWARAAIEGAQMPGWGGYDYTRLAPAVDVMELYDAGQNLDLAQAFNPQLITLMTVNWARPGALHRAWRELLRGVRGMILWDPNDRFVNPDGSLGPDGRIAAPFLADVQKSPATLIMASRRVRAPIAVLYSPESYRLQWLLDHRKMGASWTQLSSNDQNADDAVRAARRRVLGLLDRLDLSPHFISEQGLASGQLEKAHYKIVILPQTLALSVEAARAIRKFVRTGGVLVTDGQTGLFDGHGRRLAQPRLAALLDGTNSHAISLSRNDTTAIHQLGQVLKTVAITPEVQITGGTSGSGARIEHYLYRNGSLAILALLAAPAPDKKQVNTTVRLSLPRPAYIYDVRAKRLLGRVDHISVTAKDTVPTVLAMSAALLSSATCRSLLHWQTCPSRPNGAGP